MSRRLFGSCKQWYVVRLFSAISARAVAARMSSQQIVRRQVF